MAGNPKKRAIRDALTRRAEQEFGEVDARASDTPELDYAQHYLATGRTLTDLAAELALEIGAPVWRESLSRLLHAPPGAKEKLREARLEAGHALAEEAKTIVDTADTSSREELAKAKLRANHRTWLAERYNAQAFSGGKNAATVNVTFQSLHLDALRKFNSARVTATAGPALPAGDLKYEVVAEG